MVRPGIGHSVEGIHAVTAALAAGRVERLTVERSRLESLQTMLATARGLGVDVEIVADVRRDAATDAPQGVVALCRPIAFVSVEAAVAATAPAAVLVLDHLEDPRNVGALARSAVAAGIGGLVIPEHRAAPLEATAFKAAAGAFEHLAVAAVSSVANAVDALKKLQVWTVGLDAGGRQSLFGLALLAEPVAIVVGAEGSGLSRLVRERVDVVASIPIRGPVESLNASVAAALAVYELARVRAGT
ncbi:MAG TPA: 23S rRNA (guanosine(2251)-2'-O)-methyltransferase RlmB [Acidimicrobiia bacterium]|nr:23S rRNA (guanosine(2251)-2'-O)-methyltransferase RlmB [Acidimicrobiia bacterium]